MNKTQPKTFKWLAGVIFILYSIILLDLVFFSAAFGRANSEILRYQTINLIPFKTINNYLNAWEVVNHSVIITNIYGNIVAFLPFGFLTPILFRKMTSLKTILVGTLFTSFSIEMIQGLLGVGVVDIDDLILNTFGSLIGFLCYVICRKVLSRKESSI